MINSKKGSILYFLRSIYFLIQNQNQNQNSPAIVWRKMAIDLCLLCHEDKSVRMKQALDRSTAHERKEPKSASASAI